MLMGNPATSNIATEQAATFLKQAVISAWHLPVVSAERLVATSGVPLMVDLGLN